MYILSKQNKEKNGKTIHKFFKFASYKGITAPWESSEAKALELGDIVFIGRYKVKTCSKLKLGITNNV